MNFNLVAGGAASLANQFTGLFGDGGTSGLIDLLHLQMQLLQNIGGKLDAIKKELDLIVTSLLSVEAKVDALPARTAASIYKVDLQGRMLDIDELIDAFRAESETGSRQSMARLIDFIGRSYVEFRSARNRLFYLFPEAPQVEDMLVIPIAALCMHYELICLALTNQPASLRRITRNSYAAYFNKWLTGTGRLEAGLNEALLAMRSLTTSLLGEKLYTLCKNKNHTSDEPGIPPFDDYHVRIQRFARVLRARTNDADADVTKGLVARGLLTNEDLPADIAVEAVGTVKTYDFIFVYGPQSAGERAILDGPVMLDDGSQIPGTVRDLMGAPNCATAPETYPPATANLAALQADRDKKSRELICVAAMVNLARLSIGTLATAEPAEALPQASSPFGADLHYLFDVLGERSAAWQRLLTDESRKADAGRKEQLAAISEDWKALQANAARIMEEYAAAEQRVREASDQDLLAVAGRLLRPLREAAEEALASIEAAHRRVLHDIEWNLRKAIADTAAEAERAVVNIEVAAAATFDFLEAQGTGLLRSTDRAARALAQGDIVDAVWATTFVRVQQTQDNLAAAVLKSSLLKDLAMAAASIYGGPAGTAAFTAWYTYRATGGDLEAAIKAGVIAGLSSAGMDISKGIPYTELTKRTLTTAVIGAAAVAAAGGSEEDIIQGFLTGTAYTLASAYYAAKVERNMDGRVATEPAIDKFDTNNRDNYGVFTDENGDPVIVFDKKGKAFNKIDTNGIPARINQVGIASADTLGGVKGLLFAESAIPMRALGSGIPMMNAMAAFHDRMCDVLKIEDFAPTAITIIPAAILTVSASEVPLETLIVSRLNARANEKRN